MSAHKTISQQIDAIIKEPGTMFTTVPHGTMKLAEHMHKVGMLESLGQLTTLFE